MNQNTDENTGDSTEDVLDQLSTAKPGEAIFFDEAGALSPGKRQAIKREFTKLTPQVMDKRISELQRRFR